MLLADPLKEDTSFDENEIVLHGGSRRSAIPPSPRCQITQWKMYLSETHTIA